MHLHGMTGEAIQTIFISRPEQRRLPKDLRIPIRFVTIPKKRFWGLEEKWVTNEEKVHVSDLERTILDILDRPDLSGGISEIARGLWLAKKDINGSRLFQYAKRFDSLAAMKRLGFLMENLGLASQDTINEMHQFIRSSTSYAFLDPISKKEGKHLDRWRLRMNIDMADIRENLMT
jgi:predicted transcriptional regulator of viral defense system